MLYDLEGWDGGKGREAQNGGDRYIIMIDSRCCMAETTQHCKAIFHQLKNNSFFKNGVRKQLKTYIFF